MSSQNLAKLDEVTSSELPKIFMEADQQNLKNVLLDLRGSDQALKDPVNHLIPSGITTEYVNLPLNDDDIIDLLYSKIAHMPENIQFVTMCAKGYRSLIGYSLMRLIREQSWRIRVCRNSLPEIKEGLSAEKFNSLKSLSIWIVLYCSMIINCLFYLIHFCNFSHSPFSILFF